MKGHRKEREPERSGLSLVPSLPLFPPMLPPGVLVDEQGEPLKEDPKEKQEPEKKDKDKDKDKPCKTTVADLQKVFPKTKSKTLEEIADLVNKHGKDFGLDSKEKLQHFLAQAGHESRSVVTGKPFGAFEENLNYRWRDLGTRYWANYFNPIETPTKDPTKADPRDYKRSATSPFVDAEKFSNLVYNDKYRKKGQKLGNIQVGDGYKYIGRGLFQLTGRHNYEQFSYFYKQNYDSAVDLLSNPSLVASDRKVTVISALWFFKNHVENRIKITDKTTVRSVTKYVNPKLMGFPDRKKIFEKSKIDIKCH